MSSEKFPVISAASMAQSNMGKNEVKFFSRVDKKPQNYKLLTEPDRPYNGITDIFLNLYAVSEAVKTHTADKVFLLFRGWSPRFPQIESHSGQGSSPANRAILLNEDSSPSKDPEETYLKEICALLTEEDVYAEIEIDENLFIGGVFEGKNHEVKCLFAELAEATSRVFLERIKGISQDLATLTKTLDIEELDRAFVTGLYEKLEKFIELQISFCETVQAALDKLNADTFTYVEALNCFLSIYHGAAFERQVEQLPDLLEQLGKLTIFFEKNKEKCKELPTISSISVNYIVDASFVQVCVRRKDLAEKIFNCFPLKGQNDRIWQLREIYTKMCYVLTKSEFLIDIRKRGYIRPKGFKKIVNILESRLNPPYSVAYVLIRLEMDALLKKAFLYFANKIAGMKPKVKFFRELYPLLDSKRAALLYLEDLMPLKRYFNSDNPLTLSESSLKDIRVAFNSTELHPVLIMQGIIAVLLPVLVQVHDDLERILRKFQFSYDIIDILPDVPEIKEKLKGSKTLAALTQHDIATLPPFWRDIFIHKDSAVVKAFSEKQQLLTFSQDMLPSMGEIIDYSLDTSRFVIDTQCDETFLTQIDAVFDSMAKTVQDRKTVNVNNFVEHLISVLTTSVMYSENEDDSSVDQLTKDVLKEYSENLIKILEQELRRRIDAFIISEDKLSADEKNLYQFVLASLTQDSHRICEMILKALQSNEKFIRYICQNEERSEPSGIDAMVKQNAISLLRQELDRQFQEECSLKLTTARLVWFMEKRGAIAKTFIKREIGRQIELLEKANIFHEDYMQILRDKEDAIYSAILTGLNLYEEEDRLFLSHYAQILLGIPGYIMKTLPSGFPKELVSKQNIWHTKCVAKQKLSLDKEGLTELLLKVGVDYDRENMKLFQEMENALSPFRLFALIQSKLGENTYKKLAEIITAESIEEGNPTRTGVNLAANIPRMVRSRVALNGRPLPNTICPKTPSTPLSAAISITSTRKSFQNLVRNVDAEIDADSSKRWRVDKYIFPDDTQLPPILCDDVTRYNYIKVYECEDLVFTAQMRETKNATSTPLPGENIRVTSYRHEESDVAKSVKHMVDALYAAKPHTTKQPTLNISISDSVPEEELELMGKYLTEALAYNVLPRVILGGKPLDSERLDEVLEKNFSHLVTDYRNKLKQSTRATYIPNDYEFLPSVAKRNSGRGKKGVQKETHLRRSLLAELSSPTPS